MDSDRIILSNVGRGMSAPTQTDTLGLWRKDYIADGDWYVPALSTSLPVTPERRRKWAVNFALMLSRGITVPLTVDHIDVRDPKTGKLKKVALTPAMAEAKRGNVVELTNDGTKGYAVVKPADDDALTLMNRCPEVSLELTRNFKDGNGNFYDEAITAITLTPIPVVPGLDPEWERIAASRAAGGSGTILHEVDTFLAHPQMTSPPGANPDASSDLNGDLVMKPEHKKSLCTKLSLAEDTPEDQIMDAVMDLIAKHGMASDQTTKLSRDLTAANDRIKALETEVAADPIKLSRAVDVDVLEDTAANRTKDIDALVTDAKLTPAAATKLKELFVGGEGKRNAMCLSRKPSKAMGMEKSILDTVLDVLRSNDAGELSKALLSRAAGQRQTLADPHADKNLSEEERSYQAERSDLLNLTPEGRAMLARENATK